MRVKGSLRGLRPPLKNFHFWVIQAMVLVLNTVPLAVESFGVPRLPEGHALVLSLTFIALLLVPVAYAGLKFGPGGAVATSAWAAVLAFPHVVLTYVHPYQGAELTSELIQLSMFGIIASVLTQRIGQERTAKLKAGQSEAKFRALFEASPTAILLVGPTGAVVGGNPAAEALFDTTPDGLKGKAIGDLLGNELGSYLTDPRSDKGRGPDNLVIKYRDGSSVHVRPIVRRHVSNEGDPVTQVVLEDVSQDVMRHADLQAYAAQVQQAHENERSQIARDIHDDVLQRLALLSRNLDTLHPIAERFEQSAAGSLRDASNLAQGVTQTLRDFYRSMRPTVLDDLGLVPALGGILNDLRESMDIGGKFSADGSEQRLPHDVELRVFRIVQEALRNIKRHSKATEVELRVTFEPEVLRVTVTDNGVGFRVPSVNPRFSAVNQMGLLGMQERAALIGAKLDIRSSLGTGTRVTVAVPLSTGERKPALPREIPGP